MSAFQVKLKWGKEKMDLQVDTSGSVEDLKAMILSMTGVPVDRQKLTCPKAWKGQLATDTDLSTCKFKDGLTIMLIGTAEVVAAQTKEIMFVEDMKEEEVAAVSLPVGFVNLGNTCYMNSTLQCLRAVPELREGLRSFGGGDDPAGAEGGQQLAAMGLPPDMMAAMGLVPPGAAGGGGTAGAGSAGGTDEALTQALCSTLESMDKTTKPFPPVRFWQTLKQRFGQFASTAPNGAPQQQDSEELYSEVMTSLCQCLKEPRGIADLGGASNLVDALFGCEIEETLTCDECPDEPKIVKTDLSRKLVCNIQSALTGTVNIDHLNDGIKLGLKGSLEKESAILQRNALWTKTQRIKRLPRYLCVQFMRFYTKQAQVTEEGRMVLRHTKCKIMRPVTFPEVLDVYDFCTERVQGMLKTNRDRHGDEVLGSLKKEDSTGAAEMDTEDNASSAAATPAAAAAAATTSSSGGDAEPMDEDEAALQEALKLSMAGSEGGGGGDSTFGVESGETVGPGIPKDFQGNYEVFGIVTHKGRAADGGHYMGWVRQDGDDWLNFDDSVVSPCKTEHAMALKGGGDSDMAYLVFYRLKN